jgi:hypothetical protein
VTVNKERVELFVAALESDGYRQCTGQLRRPLLDTTQEGPRYWAHCALGVATEVALLHEPALRTIDELELWHRGDLHEAVAAWYGFEDGMVHLEPPEPLESWFFSDWVGGANDAGGSFWEIAQAVRTEYLKDQG